MGFKYSNLRGQNKDFNKNIININNIQNKRQSSSEIYGKSISISSPSNSSSNLQNAPFK
jgi:hypothetical protein